MTPFDYLMEQLPGLEKEWFYLSAEDKYVLRLWACFEMRVRGLLLHRL